MLLFSYLLWAPLVAALIILNPKVPTCGTVTSYQTQYSTTSVVTRTATVRASTKDCYYTVTQTQPGCTITTVTATVNPTTTVHTTVTKTTTATHTAMTTECFIMPVKKDEIPEGMTNGDRIRFGLPLRPPARRPASTRRAAANNRVLQELLDEMDFEEMDPEEIGLEDTHEEDKRFLGLLDNLLPRPAGPSCTPTTAVETTTVPKTVSVATTVTEGVCGKYGGVLFCTKGQVATETAATVTGGPTVTSTSTSTAKATVTTTVKVHTVTAWC